MTTVTIERYSAPSTVRAARRLEGACSRAVDLLAGSTVWCATTLPAGRAAALALCDCLRYASDGVVRSNTVGTRDLVSEDLRPGDVVVAHDPLDAGLAEAIRNGGAHLVVRLAAQPRGDREVLSAVNAYLMSWVVPERGMGVERIAVLVPSSGALAARDVVPGAATERRHDLGWSSALAAGVAADRADTVGGTRHARPGVPPR